MDGKLKRILIAIFLSFIGPGLGQIYNKEHKKGILLLVASTALFIIPLIWIMSQLKVALPNLKTGAVSPEIVQSAAMEILSRDKHLFNLISFTFLGVWAYAITQAYFKAKDLNSKLESKEES